MLSFIFKLKRFIIKLKMVVTMLAMFMGIMTTTSSALADCQSLNVRSVQVDLHHDPTSESPESRFNYRFQIAKTAAPDAPTVIYIPGGPGQTSISERLSVSLPEGWGLIQTDPRGTGCNHDKASELPLSALTTEFIARDILAAIKSLGLKRYILYGVSYGTMVAQVAGGIAAIERDLHLEPEAIVLEGTIGHSFSHRGEVLDGFRSRWDRLFSSLPPHIQQAFRTNPLPLGYSKDEWGSAITFLLNYGSSLPTESSLETLLRQATSSSSDEQAKARLTLSLFGQPPASRPEYTRVFRAIACREITLDAHGYNGQDVSVVLENGKLSIDTNHGCNEKFLTRPFDARDWRSQSPIYYIQGSDDPSTPLPQAVYSYDQQTRSQRAMIVIPGGGHGTAETDLGSCYLDILKQIGSNQPKLEEVLKQCGRSDLELRTAPAQSVHSRIQRLNTASHPKNGCED